MDGVDGVRGGNQCLGRNAAAVQTGAAHGGVALDKGHTHAKLSCAQCGGIAAGAGTDDCQIELFVHIDLLGSMFRKPVWLPS